MNSRSTVAFIRSPRQLLQSDTGVPHFALDPLTYRCLLSLSPAADFAEPRPPRHRYVSDNGDVFTFGESADGRLGLSAHQLANPNHPQRVESLHGVLQVACGGKHTLALTGDGNIHNSVL